MEKSNKIKVGCGCEVEGKQIVTMCPECIAGFQIAQLATRVDENPKVWINLIRSELQKHAHKVTVEARKKQSKIIRLQD
jgi:uncharacterized protein YbbK (DUF523 family)